MYLENLKRRWVPVIYKNAKKIHAVSKSLAEALINLRLVTTDPIVIPNVVNREIFNYREKVRSSTFRFIHVSSLINQKKP
jgi:hypothetical protein